MGNEKKSFPTWKWDCDFGDEGAHGTNVDGNLEKYGEEFTALQRFIRTNL